jgi:hypothetical protein
MKPTSLMSAANTVHRSAFTAGDIEELAPPFAPTSSNGRFLASADGHNPLMACVRELVRSFSHDSALLVGCLGAGLADLFSRDIAGVRIKSTSRAGKDANANAIVAAPSSNVDRFSNVATFRLVDAKGGCCELALKNVRVRLGDATAEGRS